MMAFDPTRAAEELRAIFAGERPNREPHDVYREECGGDPERIRAMLAMYELLSGGKARLIELPPGETKPRLYVWDV